MKRTKAQLEAIVDDVVKMLDYTDRSFASSSRHAPLIETVDQARTLLRGGRPPLFVREWVVRCHSGRIGDEYVVRFRGPKAKARSAFDKRRQTFRKGIVLLVRPDGRIQDVCASPKSAIQEKDRT